MSHKVVIVGEAWGEEEARAHMPFLGPAGWHLNSMLEDAGLPRHECYVTNVFNMRPMPESGSKLKPNDIENLCVPAKIKVGTKQVANPDAVTELPALRPGKFLHRKHLHHVLRLFEEIEAEAPNLIIAAGGTPCWALLLDKRITRLRGVVAQTKSLDTPRKVLPIYHPAYVMRVYSDRTVTVMDLMKAKREAEFPEIRRPERRIWVEPSLTDMERFFYEHLRKAARITFDIETAHGQITCIGFAPNSSVSIVVPFVDARKPGGSYWSTAIEERAAWNWTKKVCELPAEKVAQNGLYDLHWLWRKVGLKLSNFTHDTMLLSHALQPEAPKSLEFLGSICTDEASWKLMRKKGLSSKKREG